MAATRRRLSRLDAELVRRQLSDSREQARELITGGAVTVNGTPARNPATQVATSAALVVREQESEQQRAPSHVSRGGRKLAGALNVFVPRGLRVTGRRAVDAGASTGGFTEVLLRTGAAHVVAVDVGYGLLDWSLRTDDRVTPLDRTHVRDLTLPQLGGEPADLLTCDLSFIPLARVLPALVRCAAPGADLLLLVKPQFEAERSELDGGVVRDPAVRTRTVQQVATQAAKLGLGTRGVTASPLPGPSGNVEYFLWLHAGAPDLAPADLDRAVTEGPW